METTIKVTIRSVYGRDTIYPVCQQAKRLAAMLGTKTLTQETLRHAIGMGFRLEYVDAYRSEFSRELTA